MSRRAAQWDLVGYSSDPVPASAEEVGAVERDFRERGRVMSEAASMLSKVSAETGWIGDAAEKFADKADEAHGDLGKASEKYTGVASALSSYATVVGEVRDATWKAVQEAETADASRRANATSSLEGVDDPTDEQKDADEARDKRHSAAVEALSTARADVEKAMENLDSAASTAAGKINDASEKFSDGTWDDVKGAVSAVIKVLVDALQVIAIIVAVIIIVLLVIGTGGAFLAFLITASFWIGAAIFALTAVQVAMGDAGWGDLVWAAVGAFGGGLGKFAGKAAQGAVAASRSAMITRTAANARSSLPGLVRFGQRFPLQFVRNLANSRADRIVNRAVTEVTRNIDSGLANSRMLRVLGMEDPLNSFRSIQNMRALSPIAAEADQLTNAFRANVLSSVGAGTSLIAQGHDVTELPDTVRDLIDLPGNVGEAVTQVGDWADGVPDRPGPPAEGGHHATPAGR